MVHYALFLWNDEDARASRAAAEMRATFVAEHPAWRRVSISDRCVVYYCSDLATESARAFDGGRGIVLGQLFRASNPADPLFALSEVESFRIAHTAGRALISEFWGNYVAVLYDEQSRTHRILRGPCSTLPCLHTEACGVDLYFSCTEDVAHILPDTCSIDWSQLLRSLVGPLLSTRTGITGVRELLPGYCDEIRQAHRASHCYWNPAEIANANPLDDFWHAAAHLRIAVTNATHAWASRAPSVLHALSGGLDSSIVLSCLASAPTSPKVTCLTHFAEGADGDERPFARRVARHFGYPHAELHRLATADLRGALHGRYFETNPGMRVRDIERLEPDFARRLGADAITKGFGGDELFGRHHTSLFAADLLRRHGLSRELFSQLTHAAILEGETFWTIGARVFREAFIPHRWSLAKLFEAEQMGQSLLDADAVEAATRGTEFDLPYAASTRDCPPGKLWQIGLVCARRPYYSPWWESGDPSVISPLLSQPVVQTALRICTYLQVRHRGERAVARAAFADSLPPAISARRSKGGSEELAWRIFRANLPFIRELLLEGQLVSAGVVNRRKLESALSDSMSSEVRSTVPIFDLIGAEAWIRPWMCRASRSVPSQREKDSACGDHPAH